MISLSSRPVSFQALAIIAIFVGFLRALFEYLFFGATVSVQVLWFMPFFYFSIGVVLFAVFQRVAKIDWRRTFGAVAMGIALGLFPPLIDLIISGHGAAIRYSYNFYIQPESYPWFFYSGRQGLPAGECASVWMSIVFGSIYAYLASRSIKRSALVFALLYIIFHLYMSLIPIATAFLALGRLPDDRMAATASGHVINAVTYFFAFWYIGIALLAYFALRPLFFRLFFSRFLHILPFSLIAMTGSLITRQPFVESMLNAMSLGLVFFHSAVENDYYDSLYLAGQKAQTVTKRDVEFLRLVSIMLLSWLILLGQMIALFYLLVYLAAVIYQMPAYRARRYFAAGMKIEGLWGWLSFTSGTFVTTPVRYQGEWLIAGLLVFLGWSFISVLKDLKDLRGDRRAGNESLYLFLRRYGVKLRSSHRFVSVMIFASMLIPVAILFARKQFLPAGLMIACAMLLLIVAARYRWFVKFKWQLLVISCYLACVMAAHSHLV